MIIPHFKYMDVDLNKHFIFQKILNIYQHIYRVINRALVVFSHTFPPQIKYFSLS